ncbi:MAG: glycosyltransferase family 4 protein [Acidobacteriia bacterium]|nr:glycosyltransferase family 4 protein [Terriglobia bacterium]
MSLGVSWAREAALRFAEAGHEVHAIDFADEPSGNYLRGRSDVHDAPIARLRNTLSGVHIIPGRDISQWRYIKYAPRLRRICRSVQPDILLSLWGGGFAAISYLSGIRPYAVYVCGGDILRVSGFQKAFSRQALRRASVVFANGKHFSAKTREFVPEARIVPAYLGVDTDRFRPGNPKLPVTIVCTRGFSKVYNNRYIIEALAVMPEPVPDFRVVFTSAGDELAETRAFADRLLPPAMRRRIEFLGGVTDEELLSNLQNAHLYTSVSRYDGTSISLLEAMSCGLYPILSDIPANREWVEPSQSNGTLIPLDQPKEYAKALRRSIEGAPHQHAAMFNRGLILDRADGRKTMADVLSTLEHALRHSRN